MRDVGTEISRRPENLSSLAADRRPAILEIDLWIAHFAPRMDLVFERSQGVYLKASIMGIDLFIFGVDFHNPYTLNDVSAYTTVVRAIGEPKVITKKIRSATAFREVLRPENYFSVRQNLIYSSYRTRGREYKETPKLDRSERQWSKDYEPQKRVTLVLEKTSPVLL